MVSAGDRGSKGLRSLGAMQDPVSVKRGGGPDIATATLRKTRTYLTPRHSIETPNLPSHGDQSSVIAVHNFPSDTNSNRTVAVADDAQPFFSVGQHSAVGASPLRMVRLWGISNGSTRSRLVVREQIAKKMSP